jgi:hypothetical protein
MELVVYGICERYLVYQLHLLQLQFFALQELANPLTGKSLKREESTPGL